MIRSNYGNFRSLGYSLREEELWVPAIFLLVNINAAVLAYRSPKRLTPSTEITFLALDIVGVIAPGLASKCFFTSWWR